MAPRNNRRRNPVSGKRSSKDRMLGKGGRGRSKKRKREGSECHPKKWEMHHRREPHTKQTIDGLAKQTVSLFEGLTIHY